ncbi:MAG: 1-deoxy-D-xylulose-5-phosphate reductoisomerase [Candidatus Microthrix parvicella]|jgi:1-deoxy-D-xylulose-5-phosphate reductoisomerase|uniref:1-deoxy-D-xylulose-5-phosphate reductoisomerase n=1 Tax=Candidatus Neomicrothrix sp. TaxID=2719034 RepID=UPI0016AA492F|nr:1-deoxy-D-xylulose-5-phosphate reductoisomerase [Candidatus Microthrix sp.]MBK7019959.1 1-deoxy-D-xylulose-5-phosphate reductoisomerase [Candidatus Microthrix sp.]MBL0202794.1 1-deoxy-D-xylulose-5-phosphate reductoisomerase [Candidatus Microthrix sp.]NLH68142.1 1-deoxy-D-xylulose-5-phosphate reductoisomerase [Candidatus Microthrix parvicella]
MIDVAVLGSTGSIGTQTLEVIATEPERFRVSALSAHGSVELIAQQAAEVHPDVVVITDESRAADLAGRLPAGTTLDVGPAALEAAAASADVVINGVVGFAGLGVTLATLNAGKRLGLANKESLIAGGPVVQRARATHGAELVPVDSEHCAIHQCLRANDHPDRLARVVLTASGGPFRGRTAAELADVTVEQALDHPTWSMGPKITIDSSTLMNKGLEVIEAHELFGVDYDDIDVVVHPQSIVHSMAEFSDGTTMAQVSMPDMRLPIGYALTYPDRMGSAFGAMDWTRAVTLNFEPPDRTTFRCLDLAYAAGRLGQTAPAWLSAANEVVVEAFLSGGLRWTAIGELTDEALGQWDGTLADSVDSVLHADRRAREVTRHIISGRR